MSIHYMPGLPTRARQGLKVHLLDEGSVRTLCGKWTDETLVPQWSSCARAWTDEVSEVDCGSCIRHIERRKARSLTSSSSATPDATTF
jgi:hypothetical protein